MAIHDNTTQQPQPQAQAAQAAQPQPQAAQRPAGVPWSFHQSNLINNPTAGGSGGEYLASFKKALEEVYKEIAQGVEVKLISLNRHVLTDLKFSALVVACRYPEYAPDTVAYYTFILEATGERLKPEYRTVDNQNIQINRVTGDAHDEVLATLAYDAVKNEYKNAVCLPADCDVIFSQHRPQQDRAKMEEYAANAACACISMINVNKGNFGNLDLTNMDRDARFTIDMTFGNHQVREIDDSPVRANTILTFSSQKKTQGRNTPIGAVNVPEASTRVATLTGFLQPLWAPVESNYMSGWGGHHRQNPDTQNMVAEFVGTSLQSDYATSPSAVLLAFSSVLSLVDNNNWLMGFLPRGQQRSEPGRVNIDDIGALNIMANITNDPEHGGFGLPISLESFGGDIAKYQAYLTKLFRPGLVVSLDCPEAGPQSWIFAPFAQAALGDQEAYRLIYDAAMELTGGLFKNNFTFGDPMFTNVMRISGGSYMVGDKKQDIRHIDLTAISNVNEKNPRIIQEFVSTFADQQGVSAERALAMREAIIKEAVGHQCDLDRYYARVTFDGNFLQAISESIAQVNLPLTVNTPMSQDILRNGAPAPSFVQGSVASGTRTFRGQVYQQASRPGSGYRGRYGR